MSCRTMKGYVGSKRGINRNSSR